MTPFKGLMAVAGLLAAGASAYGATSYQLTPTSIANNLQAASGGFGGSNSGYDPYSGTLGSTSVTLFCIDYVDDSYLNTTYTSYVTALQGSTTADFNAQTRYGVTNPQTSGQLYPAGVSLYEQEAWLATQLMTINNLGAGNVTQVEANNAASIQQAMWYLTNDANIGGGGLSASPVSATGFGYTGSGTSGINGSSAQSYLQWITNAQSDWNHTVSGYTTLNLANWYIVTDVDAAGCTVGSRSGGCTAGTLGTGTDYQEMLAYSATALGTSHQSTPEPATVALIVPALGILLYLRRAAR